MGIKVKKLRKSYPEFTISLDFAVQDGETLVLAGPSGCGKTTALRLVAGLAEPEEGSVEVDGKDLTGVPVWKRNMAYVFQDLALFPHLTVGENVGYGPFIHGIGCSERRRRVKEALKAVHLSNYASRRVETLSGGERQRTAIARALASTPRVLLMDEPFSSLDAPLRRELRKEFRELRSQSELPCIFVTHDREEAALLADRIILIDQGRIIEEGKPHELFMNPKYEFTARFLGTGFIVYGERLSCEAGTMQVDSPLGLLNVPLTLDAPLETGKVKLHVPKDAFRFPSIIGGSRESEATQVACTGLLRGYSFQGTVYILEVELDDGCIIEIENSARIQIPPVGSKLDFSLDQRHLRILRST